MAKTICKWCGREPSLGDRINLHAHYLVNSNGTVPWAKILAEHERDCPAKKQLVADERRIRSEARADRDAELALARRAKRK